MDYTRQNSFKKIPKIQKQIQKKKIAIVGLGALGSNSAEQLIRMGAENLVLIDDDEIESKNICKTNLYTQKDIGKKKTKTLKKKLKQINPKAKIKTKKQKITNENLGDLLEEVAIIIDGTDNFEARIIIDNYAQKNKVPWVYAAVDGTIGTIIPFMPKETPCMKCVFDLEETELKTQEKSNGILINTIKMTTSYQIMEAIKILCDKKEDVIKEERVIDLYNAVNQYYPLQKQKNCNCMEE